MGYQDNDRFSRGRDTRDYRERQGGSPGRYGRDRWEDRGWRDDDRGFLDRAGDEVRSWFGDEDAERRRRQDDRDYGRGDRGGYARTRGWRENDDDRSYARGYGGYGSAGGYFATDYPDDYGAGRGAGATGAWGLGAGNDRETWGHDPYRHYRERQMREFDRDYDEYRREHQAKFEQDFGTWREGRRQQRQSLNQVRPQQEVVGSDSQHVGTVDKVRGDRVILTRNDLDAGGHHHSIPCSWIVSVGERVEISKTAEEAQKAWRDEENRSAFLGEEGRERDEGPHYLNRSFSGTY